MVLRLLKFYILCMSQNSYPFTRCLHPRRIINPYTRESIVVECGSCPACSLRKSSLAAMRVKLESLSHRYCMFVTLTYDNVSLPRMQLMALNRYADEDGEVQDTREPFSLVDITQRLGTEGTLLGYTNDHYFIREVLSKKVQLPSGILPYLSKYDCQLFIKRLRKNIQVRFPDDTPKIRYYLVGEYGPVHFRPHYHVILWFEEKELFARIRKIIHKSWPFGRIDCQKSRGKCADYIAKYLNSTVSLPAVFKGSAVRPFSIHSTHLGEKVFETSYEKIYTSSYSEIVRISVPEFSTDSDVVMWRSLKTFFFPKCKDYASLSKSERLYAYSTYVAAYRWTGETCVALQARYIVNALLCRFYNKDIGDDIYYYDDKLLDYFQRTSMFDPWNFEGKRFDRHIDDVFRRIYCELRLSKHFHRFVCKGFLNKYESMLIKIEEFWQQADLDNLNNQLSKQHEFTLSDLYESEEDLQFFYWNKGFDLEQFKKTKSYRTFTEVISRNSENAVKHKKLNDLNKIFIK